MSKEYCWSVDGETFHSICISPERAVLAAAKVHNLKPGTEVEVGEVLKPDVRSYVKDAIDLDLIIESVNDAASEFVGRDTVEAWPERLGGARDGLWPEEARLQEGLVDLLTKYLEEHDPPVFSGVTNIVKMTVKES